MGKFFKVDNPFSFGSTYSGDMEIRTPNPPLAKVTLCQLSYIPKLQGQLNDTKECLRSNVNLMVRLRPEIEMGFEPTQGSFADFCLNRSATQSY
jgi:hypothetical protein